MRGVRNAALYLWGIGGIVLLILRALGTLVPLAAEPVRAGMLGPGHWVLLVAWCGVNAYAEGYRGFHLKFSPRVVARARHLVANPSPLRVLLAPAFCMGLFGATKKTFWTSWILLFAITSLVLTMRYVPQPWRGIVDAGVVLGLGLGIASLAVIAWRVLVRGAPPAPHEVVD